MTLLRTSPGPNPLRGFQVDPAAIGRIGKDLQRPECILAERDGTLWSADARGGVASRHLLAPYRRYDAPRLPERRARRPLDCSLV